MSEPYNCPECGVPIHQVPRTAVTIPIALHRDSKGKLCPASGKNLVYYRWQELLRVITGREAE